MKVKLEGGDTRSKMSVKTIKVVLTTKSRQKNNHMANLYFFIQNLTIVGQNFQKFAHGGRLLGTKAHVFHPKALGVLYKERKSIFEAF